MLFSLKLEALRTHSVQIGENDYGAKIANHHVPNKEKVKQSHNRPRQALRVPGS